MGYILLGYRHSQIIKFLSWGDNTEATVVGQKIFQEGVETAGIFPFLISQHRRIWDFC